MASDDSQVNHVLSAGPGGRGDCSVAVARGPSGLRTVVVRSPAPHGAERRATVGGSLPTGAVPQTPRVSICKRVYCGYSFYLVFYPMSGLHRCAGRGVWAQFLVLPLNGRICQLIVD